LAGRFTNATGTVECSPCSGGTMQPFSGERHCEPCTDGWRTHGQVRNPFFLLAVFLCCFSSLIAVCLLLWLLNLQGSTACEKYVLLLCDLVVHVLTPWH
jgi:hypothetical protein